jgi:hypothetical protein
MICLQILQSAPGDINTLMIQDTLAEPDWAKVLGDADRCGLTRPLFHTNVTPYGNIQLNLDRGLPAPAHHPGRRRYRQDSRGHRPGGHLRRRPFPRPHY